MTGLYRFLKTFVTPISKTFFGEVRTVNYHNVHEGDPIIFVANHPSALIDPIICGCFTNVPIHFLGRADIFNTKFNNWFLRNAHMWPIYRDVDGKDSLEKNKQVFAECYASLKDGNPILLYGEGVTDEVFIRRVKKIKKGAARIAFGAEEGYDFKLGLKIVPLGINYTNPAMKDSDLMLRYAEPVVVADYKDLFDENPVKAMLEVTRLVEERILENTIHIKDKKESEGLEAVLMLFSHTMHYEKKDDVEDFSERWDQSKKIAEALNNWEDKEEKASYLDKVKAFWEKLNPSKDERYLIQLLNNEKVSTAKELFEIVFFFPFALVGVIMNLPAFYLLNSLPKKLLKRFNFHSGFKVASSLILIPLFLIIEYGIIEIFVDVPFLFLHVLFGGILTGKYALRYRRVFRKLSAKNRAKKKYNSLSKKEEVQNEFAELKKVILNHA